MNRLLFEADYRVQQVIHQVRLHIHQLRLVPLWEIPPELFDVGVRGRALEVFEAIC